LTVSIKKKPEEACERSTQMNFGWIRKKREANLRIDPY